MMVVVVDMGAVSAAQREEEEALPGRRYLKTTRQHSGISGTRFMQVGVEEEVTGPHVVE